MEHSLTRQMSLLFLARTAAFGLVFTLPLLLARVFPPEEFGLYKQIFLLYATLVAILDWGLTASLFYFVPRQPKEAPAYIQQTLLALIGLGLAGAGLLTVFKAQVAGLLNNQALEPYLPYVAVLIVLSVMTSFTESLMVMLKETHWAAITSVASELVRALLIGGAALATRSMLVLVLAATGWGLCRLLALSAYLRRRGIPWTVRPAGDRLAGQARYAAPFGLSTLTRTLGENLHQFVVSALTAPALFALYSVGYLQIPFIAIAYESVADVTLVRITELRSAGALEDAVRLIGEGALKLCLFLFPLWVWLTVAGKDLIVLLYTEQYKEAAALFRIFLVIVPLSALDLSYVPRAFAETGFLLRVHLLQVVLSAGLLAALVPPFGLGGAALAAMLTMAVTKGLFLLKVSRLFAVSLRRILPWGRIGRIGAIAWTAGLAAWSVYAGGAFAAPARVALSLGLFCGAYGFLAWAAGLVSLEGVQGLLRREGVRFRTGSVGLPNRD